MADYKQIKNILQAAVDRKEKDRLDKERAAMIDSIGQDVARSLEPTLRSIAEKFAAPVEGIREAIGDIENVIREGVRKGFSEVDIPVPQVNIEPTQVTIPPIKIPPIPTPQVTVNVPEIKVPNIIMPDELETRGWMTLVGWDKGFMSNPLPVQLRDAKGGPLNLFENLTQIVSSGGGGKTDFLTIKGFSASAYADYINADNRLRVSVETGGSGLTDAELRASSVPVAQASGALWSVSVVDIFGSTATNVVNPDGRLKVELPTGSSGLTDTELRATAVPVSQVSGARWSTEATQGTSPWVVSATDFDIRDLVNATDSVSAYQVSGAIWSTSVTNTVTVTGSLTSAVAVGPTVADTADDGSAPIQGGGIARTANPTAVAANDVVKSTHDDLGRQLMRPVQVRDLIVTAYASLTNGTETTLLVASAGSFHDLIYVMGANSSDVAVQVDIRPVTAGNIVMSLGIPASGTAGVALPVPFPQSASDTGNNWTADMPDITGTTVALSALFSREV